MRSGGTPAGTWEEPGRTGLALGASGDPAAAIRLRDGSTVHLRRARAEHAATVGGRFQERSETSRWLRCFTVCPRLDRVIDWATKVDNDRRLGLVAITADSGQLIAPPRPG